VLAALAEVVQALELAEVVIAVTQADTEMANRLVQLVEALDVDVQAVLFRQSVRPEQLHDQPFAVDVYVRCLHFTCVTQNALRVGLVFVCRVSTAWALNHDLVLSLTC
jgi:hypothetical protein